MEKLQSGYISGSSSRVITIWILLILLTTSVTGEIIFRVDPLALLSATLRTYQRAGCDTDQISLTCPRGTSISIELAQYSKVDGNDGLTIEELCPSNTNNASSLSITSASSTSASSSNSGSSSSSSSSSSSTSSGSSSNNGGGGSVPSSSSTRDDSNGQPSGNCMWPNALQYSLLQTVVEACQKKKHCKFNATPGTYGMGISGVGDSSGSTSTSMHNVNLDPCPRVRKFVEIAYKCRPYEFRSKVACENDVIQLECNPYSRIAVYSASFGRTEYESIQCPQPQGVKEETCLASYATETVMQICHGRRRCNLSADSSTFGSPCRPNSRMYLKVVYTCVPKQVLKDRYESISEPDEPEHFDGDTNDLYDEDQFYKESEAIPKLQGSPNQTSNSNTSTTVEPATSSNPIVTHPKGSNLQDDQERLYFYLLIAGSIGVLICIIVVVTRVLIQKRRERNSNQSSSPKGETTLPNGFNDSISEIDADIDLTTPVPVPSVSKNENYVTYAGATTNLYGSLGPSNVSHTSTTMLLPSNPLMCARQSPDVIGVTNTFLSQTPHASSAVGTIVPISSLAQYTTAPTYHTGYLMDPDGILRRPTSTQPTAQQATQPSETFHYDGTAPRTLSTGVAQNSQFYYG